MTDARVAVAIPSEEVRSRIERAKLAALTTGVQVAPRAVDRFSRLVRGPLTIHEYPTTGGLTLDLGHDVLVNAPFDEWFCAGSPLRLDADDDGFVLDLRGEQTRVGRVLPLPSYLGTRTRSGVPAEQLVMSHADRVRISPVVGCAYDCRFCDLAQQPYRLRPTTELLEAFDVAAGDSILPVRHALISGGSPRQGDLDAFLATCCALIKAIPLPVDLMVAPPVRTPPSMVEDLVAAGVHGVSVNLELGSAPAAELHLGRKRRATGAAFDGFVSAWVEALGRTGRVRSLIIPGLEPIDDTLEAVEHLARMGCDPVLSPFRPASGVALAQHPPATEAELATVLDAARVIVRAHGVRVGPDCLPCQHNTLSFPWDTRAAT